MRKFEIYQLGKLPPLTIVEADYWDLTKGNVLKFYQYDNAVEDNLRKVAVFNWNNVAGFKEIENAKPLNPEIKLRGVTDECNNT